MEALIAATLKVAIMALTSIIVAVITFADIKVTVLLSNNLHCYTLSYYMYTFKCG